MAAAHRVVTDTLCVRLGLIRGLTLLSRHHSPSSSIVDEFNLYQNKRKPNNSVIQHHSNGGNPTLPLNSIMFFSFHYRHVSQVRCFKVVGSLCLNRTQGSRKTQPEYFIPHERSNSTQDFTQAHSRLVTTLDLRHSCINSASCQIST